MHELEAASQLLAAVDAHLSAASDPNDETWTAERLVATWLQLKDLNAAVTLVMKEAERLAVDALDGGTVTVGERSFKGTHVPRRTFEAVNKSRLRDQMVQHVARKVALDPLTGELDSDRARVAQQTIDELDRWQTVNAAQFKQGAMKAAGVAFDDYCETVWVPALKEVPQ